jgi:pyruvate/2-oxoglutarate dehydrogenase complex dihydrolipoamide acyltransferase (E2) component
VDHRATDGATAARFLQEVVQNLENPYRLMSA